MTVVPATLFLARADDCSGGECVPLTVMTASTITCSPEGGATLGGLGVVSLRGRSTLVGGRDALLAGMQSLLAVMSSLSVQNSSHCSPLPDTLVCIQSSLPRSPPSVPVVAFFLPWPQSSSGGAIRLPPKGGCLGGVQRWLPILVLMCSHWVLFLTQFFEPPCNCYGQ